MHDECVPEETDFPCFFRKFPVPFPTPHHVRQTCASENRYVICHVLLFCLAPHGVVLKHLM
jgi:hypothetical protein